MAGDRALSLGSRTSPALEAPQPWFGGLVILTNGWWPAPQSPSVGLWGSALQRDGECRTPLPDEAPQVQG